MAIYTKKDLTLSELDSNVLRRTIFSKISQRSSWSWDLKNDRVTIELIAYGDSVGLKICANDGFYRCIWDVPLELHCSSATQAGSIVAECRRLSLRINLKLWTIVPKSILLFTTPHCGFFFWLWSPYFPFISSTIYISVAIWWPCE